MQPQGPGQPTPTQPQQPMPPQQGPHIGQPEAPRGPSMNYVIQDQAGQSYTISDQEVMNQLPQFGIQATGIDPSGLTMQVMDPEMGPQQIDVKDVLGELGWTVQGAQPVNPDYGNVQMDMRAAVSMLPDDANRQAYIKMRAQRLGVENPMIVGSGRDWNIFNPQTNSWVAVTNSPEWDVSDAVEGAYQGLRFAGAAAGGAAGGLGGPLGAAAGAGAGGAATDAALRLGYSQYDPAFASVASQNIGDQLQDIGTGAALDAATFGAGKWLQGVKPALTTGPLATGAKWTGTVGESAGKGAAGAAKWANRPMGREIGQFMVPGSAEVATVGALTELPAQATRGLAALPGWVGRQIGSRNPQMASSLQRYSRNLMRPRPNSMPGPSGAEEAAQFFRTGSSAMPPRTATTADIWGNIGESIGGRVGKAFAGRGSRMRASQQATSQALRQGVPPGREAAMVGRNAAQQVGQRPQTWGYAGGQMGERFGRALQGAEEFGGSMLNLTRGATGMGLRGIEGAGRMSQTVGSGLRNVGTVMQPLEMPAYARFGAEELLDPYVEGVSPYPWQR